MLPQRSVTPGAGVSFSLLSSLFHLHLKFVSRRCRSGGNCGKRWAPESRFPSAVGTGGKTRLLDSVLRCGRFSTAFHSAAVSTAFPSGDHFDWRSRICRALSFPQNSNDPFFAASLYHDDFLEKGVARSCVRAPGCAFYGELSINYGLS